MLDGKLYEGTLADFYVDRVSDFEAKSGNAEDRRELRALSEGSRFVFDNV